MSYAGCLADLGVTEKVLENMKSEFEDATELDGCEFLVVHPLMADEELP